MCSDLLARPPIHCLSDNFRILFHPEAQTFRLPPTTHKPFREQRDNNKLQMKYPAYAGVNGAANNRLAVRGSTVAVARRLRDAGGPYLHESYLA